jgi:hypothetical protein
LDIKWPNYRPPGNFRPEVSRLVGLRVDEELLLRCSQALQDLSLVGVQVLVVQQVRQHKPEQGKLYNRIIKSFTSVLQVKIRMKQKLFWIIGEKNDFM